jgi:hypothetical protein
MDKAPKACGGYKVWEREIKKRRGKINEEGKGKIRGRKKRKKEGYYEHFTHLFLLSHTG